MPRIFCYAPTNLATPCSPPPAGVPLFQLDASVGSTTAGNLPPSVVEVQVAAAHSDAAAASSGDARLLLMSGGDGGVTLVVRPSADQQKGAAVPPYVRTSAAVLPLRPAPPLQGVRPVHLAAAFRLPPTAADAGQETEGILAGFDMCCILWAARPRCGRRPSRCEVYAVRLSAQLGLGAALEVREVQLLKVGGEPALLDRCAC